MPSITVPEKLYGSVSPAVFEEIYSELLSGLNVQLRFVGTTRHGWIMLDVSGDDETAALSLLSREAGLAPSLDSLEKFSVVKGKVVFSGRSETELFVDLAVSSEPLDSVVSEKTLRCQLADGKEFSVKQLAGLFFLYDNVPLEVKLVQDVKSGEPVAAVLSEAQLSLFKGWVRSRFDRLIVLGSLLSDVERAVSRLGRDIIGVESLGVLEQVVLCKLGTDAVGLIPRIGRYLKSAVLVPFSPKKIIKAVGSEPFDLVT
jgi:hypothetical protein